MTGSPGDRALTHIPRSTGARRHGPTKARRQQGELNAVAPVSRQVTKVTVTVEQLEDGRWRFTQPKAPGWVQAAHNPAGVTAALRQAFTEAQVAAHSQWRGTQYDQPDAFAHKRHKPRSRGSRRCDVYDPRSWLLAPDDPTVWISPKGHRYSESRQAVQRVMKARQDMGLAPRPDPINPDPIPEQESA